MWAFSADVRYDHYLLTLVLEAKWHEALSERSTTPDQHGRARQHTKYDCVKVG